MNMRTTFVLLALVAVGAGIWFVGIRLPEQMTPAPLSPNPGSSDNSDTRSLAVFENETERESIQSIAVHRRDVQVVELEKAKDGTWAVRGGFRPRDEAIVDFVNRVLYLQTRFEPFPLPDDQDEEKVKLVEFGLDHPALTIDISLPKAAGKATEHKLEFGEGHDPESSFYRPTYLRVDDRKQVFRLAPGLLSQLGRPRDFYLRRALFTTDRVAKSSGSSEQVDKFAGTRIRATDAAAGTSYLLERSASKEWHFVEPSVDRVDPGQLSDLKAVLADLWVEQFVSPQGLIARHFTSLVGRLGQLDSPLAGAAWTAPVLPSEKAETGAAPTSVQDWVNLLTGLDQVRQKIEVTDREGARTLLLGRMSPSPAGLFAQANPASPAGATPYRYARLSDSDYIFVVSANGLPSIFRSYVDMRENALISQDGIGGGSADVRQIEVVRGTQQQQRDQVVLTRDADNSKRWQVELPGEGAAGQAATSFASNKRVDALIQAVMTANAQYKEADQRLFALAGVALGASPLGSSCPNTAVALGGSKVWLIPDDQAFAHIDATIKLTIKEKDREKPLVTVLRIGHHDARSDKIAVKVDDWPRVLVVDGATRSQSHNPAYWFHQLFDMTAADVKQLTVEREAGKIALAQEAGKWKLTLPAPVDADESKVIGLVEALAEMAPTNSGASEEAMSLKYGLGPTSATITASFKDQKRTLRIGNQRPDKTSYYAKLDGSRHVFSISSEVQKLVTRSHLEYVSRELLSFAGDRVTGLVRQKGPESFEIATQDGEWRIVRPEPLSADEKAVKDLFQRLGELRALSIVEFPLQDAKKYGLDPAYAVLTVRVSGTDSKAGEHTIALGAEVPGKKGERYVRVDNGPSVAILPAQVVEKLAAAPFAFRDRQIAKFGDADKLVLQQGVRQATFTRPAGNWKLTAPIEDAKLDNEGLDDLIAKAAKLEADELVTDKATTPEALKPYGLDRPTVRWQFFDGDKQVLDLLVGNLDASGKRAHARLGNGGLVFLMTPDLTRRVLGEFRDRKVWATPLDALRMDSVTITRAGKTLALRKEGMDWKVIGKPEIKLANDTVIDTLTAFGFLQMEHYAIDKGADFKMFGLDPAETVFEVASGDRKVILHLGKFEGDSKRAYARVPDKDRTDVFVLSADDTMRLTRDLDAFMKPLAPKVSPPIPK